jgi:hypothetical protein
MVFGGGLLARIKPYHEEDGIGTVGNACPEPSPGTRDGNIHGTQNDRSSTDSPIRDTATDPLDTGTGRPEPNQPSSMPIIKVTD